MNSEKENKKEDSTNQAVDNTISQNPNLDKNSTHENFNSKSASNIHNKEKKVNLNIPYDENFQNENNKENDEKSTENLQKEIEKLKEENNKLKDSYLRAYAESENTKKRCQQEIEKNSKFAISSFAKELLSVADNLQRAMSVVNEDMMTQCESFIKGVELTQTELSKIFEKFGISKIESLDKIFDPNFERVVQEIENTEKPAGTIIAELQSGYMINDRILREAMVVVTKGGK